MRDVKQVLFAVDSLALSCCTPLQGVEKDSYFNETGIKRYYVKGKNKGKERDIYEINGMLFNKIWDLVYPYAYKSAMRSTYGCVDKAEDALAEIKYLLFRYLKFLGPSYNNIPLSKNIPLIVNNVLTNYSNKCKRTPIDLSYTYDDDSKREGEEEEHFIEEVVRVLKRKSEAYEISIDVNCSIPEVFKGVAENICAGVSLVNISKELDISYIKLKKELQKSFMFLKH